MESNGDSDVVKDRGQTPTPPVASPNPSATPSPKPLAADCAGNWPTPPTTPEQKRKADSVSPLQHFTPTALGFWLKNQPVPQSDVDAEEVVFLSEIMEHDVVHQELQDFVADSKDVKDYVKRVFTVAKLIPASPPMDPSSYPIKKRTCLKLVFSCSALYSPCLPRL
jgi:hypothetical protein